MNESSFLVLGMLGAMVGMFAGCRAFAPGAVGENRSAGTTPPAAVDHGQGIEVDYQRIVARDAVVTRSKDDAGLPVLNIATGHSQPGWAGVDLPFAGGPRDISRYRFVAAQVRNLGDKPARIEVRVNNAGPSADAKGTCAFAALDLQPKQGWTWAMAPIARSPDTVKVTLFGMDTLPWRVAGPNDLADPSRSTAVVVTTPDPKDPHRFEVRNIRAVGCAPPVALTADPDRLFPVMDGFGQFAHGDWPGKVRSVKDLARWLKDETADLAAHPGPDDLDRYGGWMKGPALEATGFFYAAKHDGKWWLVDPEGRLFFSIGLCCVNSTAATFTDGRERWFEDLPALQARFTGCVGDGAGANGYYKGKRSRWFDFGMANIIRKYGANWASDFAAISHRRLRSWGLNTIANWSQAELCLQRKTPYTWAIWFGNLKTVGNGFYDVFDPGFEDAVFKKVAELAKPSVGDPWCIGYFVDNELPWGWDDGSLALAALAAPADQPAKKAFLEDLKDTYGEIAKLNAAWGANHASWDALRHSTAAPDAGRAQGDLVAFQTRIAETYFKTVRDAVKAAAPNQLYLGCRFYQSNKPVVAAAAKYCDVVSYNLYRFSVSDFNLPVEADVPIVIGEFSSFAADAGMMGGFWMVPDQNARAAAYEEYVRGALRHPQIVGCHWFQYRDEPTTARAFDDENFQLGFIDIADTPYPEMVGAARAVARDMYKTRSGAE